MRIIIVILLALWAVACEGPEGPMGPEGPSGDPAETEALEARLAQLEATIDSLLLLPNDQSPISTPTPLPIVLQGEGNQVTERFTLQAGMLLVVRVEKQEDSYFILYLIDGNTGEEVGSSLLNESSGSPTTSTAFNVEETGEYLLQVSNASGPWTITIEK